MRKYTYLICLAGLIAFILISACENGTEEPELNFEDFTEGKYDTGYVGTEAAEIEGELTGKVYVDLSSMSEAQKQEYLNNIHENPTEALSGVVTTQVRYARNQLKDNKFDLNIERGNPVVTSVEETGNGLMVSFTLQVDSLIKFKDLQEKGISAQDLVGQTLQITLPIDPSQALKKGGAACASEDGQPVPADEINEWNYFYYFDPFKDGCTFDKNTDLYVANFVVHSSLDTPTVYPEYDLLIQDGVITMVALFGQIEHGELKSDDLGWWGYRQWLSDLQSIGFKKTKELSNGFGSVYQATYAGNLKIIIDNYSPAALADSRSRSEVDQLFKDTIKSHEIVYYNGHSFYGSLSVLDDPEIYPLNTYQIIFMDSCWSYSYYTRQVFNSRITEEDPDGTKYTDVINNTEPGITGSHKTAIDLYENIFIASSKLANGERPTKYSWNKLIEFMNLSAKQRAEWRGDEKAEIYGVSGARNNAYNPNESTEPTGEGVEAESNQKIAIPDNNEQGITSTLTINKNGPITDLFVEVDIEHEWTSDLIITLTHGERSVILYNRGVSIDFEKGIKEFNGMDMSGDWILNVKDVAARDTGSLNRWSIKVIPYTSN